MAFTGASRGFGLAISIAFLFSEDRLIYAIFLPLHDAVINDIEFSKGDVIEFDKQKGTIEIFNKANVAIDIIIFGGEQCKKRFAKY
jgi:NAD(P)-dependent dehydrogenase (short-subunit alcohol dehydrogenase family)